MAKEKNSYERLQAHIFSLKTPDIECWQFQYHGTDTELNIHIPEFTCICPKTGLPDFADLEIKYFPSKFCLELKSLKNYILFYRNLGIFHEHVVNKILEDCRRVCRPIRMEVRGIFNSRGGIQTTAVARHPKTKR